MQETNRQKKKKSRVRFERLMCHVGYGTSVLIIWNFVRLGIGIINDIYK